MLRNLPTDVAIESVEDMLSTMFLNASDTLDMLSVRAIVSYMIVVDV